MRSVLFLFITSIVFNSAYSQVLQKGNVDINAGVGFGIYTITSNDYEDEKSAGVPGLLTLGVAYQLTDAWSIGLNYERNGFVTDPDSNNKAVLNNMGITGSYNFVNGEKNVLHAFLGIGYSSFRYDNLKDEEYVVGKGPQFQLGAGWKHYFGGKIGMYMNFSVPYYNYTKFKNGDGEELKIYRTNVLGQVIENKTYTISMVGANFRIGLLLKL